jgi:hypothetical protein
MRVWAVIAFLIAGPAMAQSSLAPSYKGKWAAADGSAYAGNRGEWWLTEVKLVGNQVTGKTNFGRSHSCGWMTVNGTFVSNRLALTADTTTGPCASFPVTITLTVNGRDVKGTYTNNSKMMGEITAGAN